MIRRLNIVLGAACNRHCSYCCQAAPADRLSCGKTDWLGLREKLRFYNEHGAFRKLERISFWGGEPMLYWGVVKALYQVLCDDGVYPDSIYRVATNGDLINEDYVQFANSTPGWLTTVSWHDGSISESQWSVLRRLDNCFITGLVTSRWRDEIPAMRDKYDSLGLSLPVQLWPVHFVGQCSEDDKLTAKSVDDALEYIRILVANPQDRFSAVLRKSIIAHASRRGRERPDCGDESVLTVDLHGREYLCQHNPSPETLSSHSRLYRAEPVRKGCRECVAWDHCGGGCFLTSNRKAECRFYRGYVQLGRSLNETAS